MAEAFEKAIEKSTEILRDISIPIELSDQKSLQQSASTALNSKLNQFVSQHIYLLAPIAVQAKLKVINPAIDNNVDLHDIGTADLIEQITPGSDRTVKITRVAHPDHTILILLRGSNILVLEEGDRSIHDFVKERALIAGGEAPEIELSVRLVEYAQSLPGVDQYCIRSFAEALEVILYTLAENTGLNPIATVTELRNRHTQNDINAGINTRKIDFLIFYVLF